MVKVAEFGMTRREEIYEASCECYNGYIDVVNVNADAAQDAFIKGAEWADKTLIEKVCKYLRQSLYNTPIFEHDEDETPVNYVCASCCNSVEEFIENFCKVMEE